ncbi:flavodoxin family protein [Candidatus Dojkabacteria bacterium]|nr:flavodoxin family protein [Candidatus Dojkabacteria bacterium]
MKIGIIVYSDTGNTLSVAEKIRKRLSSSGHEVVIERIEIEGKLRDIQGAKEVVFTKSPDIGEYDYLIFGSFVMAFMLNAVMKAYMKRLGSLSGKKFAVLITQGFWYPWLGGNSAVNWIRRSCESKGATFLGSGIVNWMRKDREEQIVNVVEKISSLF